MSACRPSIRPSHTEVLFLCHARAPRDRRAYACHSRAAQAASGAQSGGGGTTCRHANRALLFCSSSQQWGHWTRKSWPVRAMSGLPLEAMGKRTCQYRRSGRQRSFGNRVINAALTGKRGGASVGEHNAASHLNRLAHTFSVHRLDLDACESEVSMAWAGSVAVDLDHLSVRPLDRIGRRHALYRLRVHVDDDVLGLHLGGFLVG